jgi:putative endopeptidase
MLDVKQLDVFLQGRRDLSCALLYLSSPWHILAKFSSACFPLYMSSFLDPENFDKTVRPADDFFQYVNGGWMAANPIPADEARWGSFDILRVQVEEQMHAILETTGDQRIRDFYLMGMDVEKRNRLGVEPLKELFARIDGIANNDDLAAVIGYLQRQGVGVWWTPSAEQDEKQSEVVALHLYQGGLGLPDRDYYLNDDEKSKTIRADYLKYMKAMLVRLGVVERANAQNLIKVPDATTGAAADAIMAIETDLARASMTRVELRDVEKMYNKMSAAELAAVTPRIAWAKYFEAVGIAQPAYFIVGQPKFFAEVDRLFESLPLDQIKIYLRWQTLNSFSGFLTEELERARFDFYARTFNGAKEMKALWRRVLGVANASLDEMLGKLYVEKHFGGDAKAKINLLVDHLTAAYRARIEKLDWMSPETKAKAIEKLQGVSRKLGYPDVWKDMSALVVATDSYAQNVMRTHAFEFDRKMHEVGGPVNREEWFMPPQMINAYYQPPLNEIGFPAAILQPPFFDPAADDALNYGGIGTVIGHELTHGLDDQGALFDVHGNLKNWWTPEDKARFEARAAHLAEQFDKYEPLPGVHINGKLTLGENIADLGGILIALDGLKLALGEKITAGDVTANASIDGFTPVQRFFMNYAVYERGHIREELERLYIQVDPHSPGKFRVNGPSSNYPEFYEAFDVKEGDKLWREPEDRVQIW